LASLDLDTLEYVTGKINSSKANAPEVAGNPRSDHKQITEDWTKMDERERRKNWDNIVASAKTKN